MKMGNPYSMVFGKEPELLISRTAQFHTIISDFTAETPPYQTYLLTGVRGSGKTVMMTDIVNYFRKDKDWVVVELNPDRDLLTGLAANLTSNQKFARIFQTAKLNLSFLGLGVEVGGVSPIVDIEVAIREMIAQLQKHNKKILVTIDEVTNNENIRAFASAFQIMVRQNLPVFLLMTGLYENINAIQDERNLTFLYRAPKIEMKSLNIGMIAEKYEKSINLSYEESLEMAKCTKGYPFAFQVLGYLTWNNRGNYKEVLPEYRQCLEEYVYEKIWSELSSKDKQIAYAIARCPSGKVKEIREKLEIETNAFNPYRKRMIKKGIVDGSEYGVLKFTLPFFERFVIENYDEI